tara:strand:+ start:577 stop:732 length:156 start_codon:yes stop_codon:yes gene_type:complete
MTVLQLLEIGVSWDAINNLTENEVNMILGIDSAIKEYRAEVEASSRAMNKL